MTKKKYYYAILNKENGAILEYWDKMIALFYDRDDARKAAKAYPMYKVYRVSLEELNQLLVKSVVHD